MKHVYLFVEGNTDKALIEVLVQKYFGFKEYKNLNDMPVLLARQVSYYPQPDGNLENKRRPSFLHRENECMMIEAVGGNGFFAERIAGRLMTVSLESVGEDDELVIVVIQDRDLAKDEEKEKKLRSALKGKGLILEKDALIYEEDSYSFFSCLIPFDKKGAVEALILDIADKTHHDLFEVSCGYKEKIEDERFTCYRDEWSKSVAHQKMYADKVQVGAITAVLKPDSSPAMMVRDKLIRKSNIDEIRDDSEIRKLIDFLEMVVG